MVLRSVSLGFLTLWKCPRELSVNQILKTSNKKLMWKLFLESSMKRTMLKPMWGLWKSFLKQTYSRFEVQLMSLNYIIMSLNLPLNHITKTKAISTVTSNKPIENTLTLPKLKIIHRWDPDNDIWHVLVSLFPYIYPNQGFLVYKCHHLSQNYLNKFGSVSSHWCSFHCWKIVKLCDQLKFCADSAFFIY